jgi:hypothetical protein
MQSIARLFILLFFVIVLLLKKIDIKTHAKQF